MATISEDADPRMFGFRFACAKRIFPFLFLLMLPVISHAQFQYSTNFTYVTNNAVITTNGSIIITNYIGDGGAVTIPNTIGGYPVTEIGDGAFEGSETLTSVIIGTNVTDIGTNAFSGCDALNSVIIPGSVTNISDYAFAICYNLSAIYFEGNAPNLGLVPFDIDPVTAYYLATTSGWPEFNDNTYISIALWLPQLQTVGAGPGAQNPFTFTINWASEQTVVVQACTNILNPVWLPIQTNVLSSNSVPFSDLRWTNYPHRFYQVASP